MQNLKAKTAKEYIDARPPERKKAIEAVRKMALKNLPKGYEENIQWGMITYAVPLKLYPKGYGGNKNVPLPLMSLGSQKHHMALYMMNVYGNKELDKWFRQAYKATGKKLDMGKGCLRFKKLDDLALDVVAKAITKISVKDFIAQYEAARRK